MASSGYDEARALDERSRNTMRLPTAYRRRFRSLFATHRSLSMC